MLVVFYGVDNSKKTTRAKALVAALQKEGYRAKFTKRPYEAPPDGLSQEDLYQWMFKDAVLHYVEEVHPFRQNTIIIQDRGVLCAEVYNKPKGNDPAFEAQKAQNEFAKKAWGEVDSRYGDSDILTGLEILPDLHVFCHVWESDLRFNYARKEEVFTEEIRKLSIARQAHYKEILEAQGVILPHLQLRSSQIGVEEPLFEEITKRRLVHFTLTQAELLQTLENYK